MIFKRIWEFLKEKKKFWLLPIIIILGIFGILIVFNSRNCYSSIYLYNILVTSILGISAFYHDSAAALVVDGKIISAAPGGEIF